MKAMCTWTSWTWNMDNNNECEQTKQIQNGNVMAMEQTGMPATATTTCKGVKQQECGQHCQAAHTISEQQVDKYDDKDNE